MEDTTNLNTSKLGTKQYWDDFYKLERNNFKENANDTGERWFDDNNAEDKMIQFLDDNVGQFSIRSDSSMIDLGTGNGHLLFALRENEFTGKFLGIDYSSESVQFANDIAKTNQINDISFEQADIFADNWNPGKFDIVLDKGTLDAIALSGLKTSDGKPVTTIYNKIISKLLNSGGVFLITSCNFTQQELIKIIEDEHLQMWEIIQYPLFEFGGVKGTTICTIAFTKR